MPRRLFRSVAFRMALGHGVLVVIRMAIISGALYFGTVVIIDRVIDAKLSKLSEDLVERFQTGNVEAVQCRIH